MLCCMSGSTRSPAAIGLGEKLRALREKHGLTTRKMAAEIGRKESDSGLITRWETGERTPRPDDIARIVEAFDLDAEEAAEFSEMSSSATQSPWLAVSLPARQQQVRALLRVERTAKRAIHVALGLIPGVLQTAEVIRAIMVDAGVPEDEIDERVNTRIGRRQLITRKNPAHLEVLLDEAAIRHIIGSRQIMAEQLRYLLEFGDVPNVDLRIVPYSASWTPALTGSFILFDSDEAPSIVSLEMHRSGLILHDPNDIAVYRQDADAVREKAMGPAATAELIAEVATELEIE
jgi:transcriptional regulator with XRE-family HTH domain